MKIGLVDVDGHNFPNIPLMKLSAYYKSLGASVDWANGIEYYDCIYMSKVFTFTPDNDTAYQADEFIRGGTGYDLKNKLPTEIESMCPDYSLYWKHSEAYGFLTRGCPRGCKFCIVAEKEGRKSVQVADLAQFCRGQKKIKLLDPNLLACKDRDNLLQQLIDSKAYIDFTQGLDVRFADNHVINMLNAMKVKMIHFAWDNPDEDLTADFMRVKAYTKLDKRRLSVYVLTNFNSTHEQDLYRIYKLREMGFNPFVMVYDKENATQSVKDVQRWVNDRKIWNVCSKFEDYNPKSG